MSFRQTKKDVAAGRVSPMAALNIAVAARLAGHPNRTFEQWAENRVARVRSRGGNPLIRKRKGR